MKKINIDIADDHKMVLSGLQNILKAFPNMKVTHLYSCGMDLLKGLQQSQPDVLLLDIQMPDISGEELAPIILKSYPKIRILVTTGFDTTYHTKSMMEKGVLGYILKNANESLLKEAIEIVYRGDKFIDPYMKDKLVEESIFSGSDTSAPPSLTRREKEILKLVMEEKTSQEIADTLRLSLRTIENQRVNLMQKLEVKNAVGLAKRTIEWKLLE